MQTGVVNCNVAKYASLNVGLHTSAVVLLLLAVESLAQETSRVSPRDCGSCHA
jgi:hypothetical protein